MANSKWPMRTSNGWVVVWEVIETVSEDFEDVENTVAVFKNPENAVRFVFDTGRTIGHMVEMRLYKPSRMKNNPKIKD